jgi:hypothetical protein
VSVGRSAKRIKGKLSQVFIAKDVKAKNFPGERKLFISLHLQVG